MNFLIAAPYPNIPNYYTSAKRGRSRKRYRFGDDGAPAFIESPLHDGVVGAGRARADDKWVGHLQPIYRDTKIRLRSLSLRSYSESHSVCTESTTRPPAGLNRRSADLGGKSERFHYCFGGVEVADGDENEYLRIAIVLYK